LGALYYFVGVPGLVDSYSDLSAQHDTLLAQQKKLSDDERKLKKRLTDYNTLLQQKADAEDRVKKNAVKLPSAAELPAFYEHLETQASTAGVHLQNRTFDKETPVETYMKVPVKMEVRGDFNHLVQYFALLNETPRIITVEGLTIGDGKIEGD